MNKIITLIILLLSSVLVNAQSEHELIKRKLFFGGEQRYNFKTDPSGEKIFFQSTISNTSIFYFSVTNPDYVDSLSFPGRIVSWTPTSKGIIAIHQTKTCMELTDKKFNNSKYHIPLPEGTFEADIIEKSKQGSERYAIIIRSSIKELSGIYSFEFQTKKLTKIYDIQSSSSLFFDGDLNLAAANMMNGSEVNVLSN